MTHIEAMKQALEALEANQPVNYCMNNNGEKFPMMQEDPFRFERNSKAITAIKEALAQTEQEPVAWLLTDKNINSLQVDSIQRLINRLKHAHHTDIRVRINGQDEWFQADWLKHLTRTTPPQRKPLTEKRIEELYSFWVVDCQDIVGFARAVERTVKGEV